MKINYAVYSKITDINPLVRCNTIEDAIAELTNSDDGAIIVCEVSEIQQDGSFIITQERVVEAPKIWLPADRFIPEYDGYYLCYLVRKEECGNIVRFKKVLNFEKMKWEENKNSNLINWMIVKDPELKTK